LEEKPPFFVKKGFGRLNLPEWAAYQRTKWETQRRMPMYLPRMVIPDYIDPRPTYYGLPFAGTSGSKGMGINFSSPEWDALFAQDQTNPDPKVSSRYLKRYRSSGQLNVPTTPLLFRVICKYLPIRMSTE